MGFQFIGLEDGYAPSRMSKCRVRRYSVKSVSDEGQTVVR
jgi:hypothetical protein